MSVENFFLECQMAESTEITYRATIEKIVNDIPDLSRLTAADLRVWLDKHQWSSSTRWVACIAIKKYLAWKYGGEHPALKLKITRDASGPQRSMDTIQATKLLESFDESPKGLRDRALAALLLDTGLRATEVCNLELKHLHLAERSLSVLCKGGEWGEGVFSYKTREYLEAWLMVRSDFAEDITVFVSIGGLCRGKRLTRHGLRLIVAKWGKALGIDLSPHDFRRTFAVLATQSGAPARVLQVAGRWKSMAMVERYTSNITARDFARYYPVNSLVDQASSD